MTYDNDHVLGSRYIVCQMLGRGGFGIVYRVRSTDDDSEFALKTYRDEFTHDERVKQTFRTEALTWVAMGKHSFIAQAHGVHEFDGRLFVAMEYVGPDEHGLTTLHDLIRSGRGYSDRQIGAWGMEFCHGMEHAKLMGLRAHRDIKPLEYPGWARTLSKNS
jgi:serine/threonine protein kinase